MGCRSFRDNIRVQQQALDLARKSYDHDKQALDLGALAKLHDLLIGKTQVAERNRDVIHAQYQYKAALDGFALVVLTRADLTAALRSTEIVLYPDDPTMAPSAIDNSAF